MFGVTLTAALDNWNKALKQNNADKLNFSQDLGEMQISSTPAEVDIALVRKLVRKHFSPACVHLCCVFVWRAIEQILLICTKDALGEVGTTGEENYFPSTLLSSWLRPL